MEKDEEYMKMTLNLAEKGEGYTSPNPIVGAVVVKKGEVLGKGYHQYWGGPHAEVYALKEAGKEAEDATIYVNLEPCCHHGKTPPCSQKIIKSGIKRVVIGMKDPDPRVQGKSIKKFRERGIEVRTGVLEEKAKKLNEIFIKYKTTNLPFVILKTASTLDGFLAAASGDSQWITNKKARQYGHRLRHKVDAVLVGIGTVVHDNPRLTTRISQGKGKDSVRVILDTELKTPLEAEIINQNSEAGTIIAAKADIEKEKPRKYEELLQNKGIKIWTYNLNSDKLIPVLKLLQDLHQENISSVLIEGGGKVNFSFLKEKLIDKYYAFIAPKLLGGNDGISLFQGEGPQSMEEVNHIKEVNLEKIDNNFLIKGYLE